MDHLSNPFKQQGPVSRKRDASSRSLLGAQGKTYADRLERAYGKTAMPVEEPSLEGTEITLTPGEERRRMLLNTARETLELAEHAAYQEVQPKLHTIMMQIEILKAKCEMHALDLEAVQALQRLIESYKDKTIVDDLVDYIDDAVYPSVIVEAIKSGLAQHQGGLQPYLNAKILWQERTVISPEKAQEILECALRTPAVDFYQCGMQLIRIIERQGGNSLPLFEQVVERVKVLELFRSPNSRKGHKPIAMEMVDHCLQLGLYEDALYFTSAMVGRDDCVDVYTQFILDTRTPLAFRQRAIAALRSSAVKWESSVLKERCLIARAQAGDPHAAPPPIEELIEVAEHIHPVSQGACYLAIAQVQADLRDEKGVSDMLKRARQVVEGLKAPGCVHDLYNIIQADLLYGRLSEAHADIQTLEKQFLAPRLRGEAGHARVWLIGVLADIQPDMVLPHVKELLACKAQWDIEASRDPDKYEPVDRVAMIKALAKASINLYQQASKV